jgi:hypothetical protein
MKSNIIKKIKSLTPKEVIMAMVEGLQNPKTEIDMSTYGYKDDGVCFGCAATNCLLTLDSTLELLDSFRIVDSGFSLSFKEDHEQDFIQEFEFAINDLRCGDTDGCNFHLERIKLPTIVNNNNIELPYLTDYYTQESLIPYIKLAESQS